MKPRPLTKTDALIIAIRIIFWLFVWWISTTYIKIDHDSIRVIFFCAVVALAFGTRVLLREWVKVRE